MSGFGTTEGGLSFGSVSSGETTFKFGEAGAKFGESFSAGPQFGAATEGDAGASTKDGEETVPEAESTAEFVPVVQLDEVEVKTHEEEEEAIFKMRSKLFRFTETLLNKGTGKKEWIERGVGEVKLLKHRENSKIRVLMRQEKTMKIIANHVVHPGIELAANAGSDRSWVWSVYDFAEGELVEEVFAIRFSNAENANKFKEAFEAAQKEMAKLEGGEDAAEAAPEAEEAADALSKLSAAEKPAAEKPTEEDAA